MIRHKEIDEARLREKLRSKKISLGGNRNLKIYGRLNCASGKRMKRKNRVFFADKNEAQQHGYRPCGHCMKVKYLSWKHASD